MWCIRDLAKYSTSILSFITSASEINPRSVNFLQTVDNRLFAKKLYSRIVSCKFVSVNNLMQSWFNFHGAWVNRLEAYCEE